MLVLGRNEINRARWGSILTLIMSTAVLFGIGLSFSSGTDAIHALLIGLAVAALAAFLLSAFQIWSHQARSQVVIFHQGEDMVIAANHLHEGFKLRFFRDILDDHLIPFSDEDRIKWSVLAKEGFHPVLNVRNARKTLILPLCFMIFDDVFVFDHTQRWDHFDCANTSNPTFAERGVSPFKDDNVIPVSKEEAVGTSS